MIKFKKIRQTTGLSGGLNYNISTILCFIAYTAAWVLSETFIFLKILDT